MHPQKLPSSLTRCLRCSEVASKRQGCSGAVWLSAASFRRSSISCLTHQSTPHDAASPALPGGDFRSVSGMCDAPIVYIHHVSACRLHRGALVPRFCVAHCAPTILRVVSAISGLCGLLRVLVLATTFVVVHRLHSRGFCCHSRLSRSCSRSSASCRSAVNLCSAPLGNWLGLRLALQRVCRALAVINTTPIGAHSAATSPSGLQ